MSTQPNALRLAEILSMPGYGWNSTPGECACELRAQHELIQKLKAALEGCIDEAEETVTNHLLIYGETYKPALLALRRKQVADAHAALAAAEAHK